MLYPNVVLVDSLPLAYAICVAIRKNYKLIAFDLEGVNLGKNGLLTLLQIAVDEYTVYCFDVLVLGKVIFTEEFLGSIFASYEIIKLCFDCRIDGEVMQIHLNHLRVNALFDVQVLYTMLFQAPRDRYLKGLQHVLQSQEEVVQHKETLHSVVSLKHQIKSLLKNSSDQNHLFLKRPIAQEILEYCASDVIYLLRMHFLWSAKEVHPNTVLKITNDRLRRFCSRKNPIAPRHMSLVDFPFFMKINKKA